MSTECAIEAIRALTDLLRMQKELNASPERVEATNKKIDELLKLL